MSNISAYVNTGFVIMPKELTRIDTKHRFLDIAIYFVLKSHCCNGKSRIGFDKITAKLNISKRDASLALKELKELGYINCEQLPSDKNQYVFNEYEFTSNLDAGFEMIGRELINQNLKAKQIGLLIYLKLASEFGWYRFRDYTELGKKLGVTRQTASKYIKDLKDYIEPSKAGGLHFINQIFTFKERKETTKLTFIL